MPKDYFPFRVTLALSAALVLPLAMPAGGKANNGGVPAVRIKQLRDSAPRATGKRPYYVRRPFVNGTSLLVLGGGATLPAITLTGLSGATGPRPAVTQGSGSILAYFNANAPLPLNAGTNTVWATSYCQTGSDFGIGVLNGSNPEPQLCPTIGRHGLLPLSGANAFDSPGETDSADFTVSDAPVTQAQYSALAANYPGSGELVQVPFVANSIGIAFHNVDVAGHYLKLTIPEICQIADGEITDWDEIPRAADPTVTTGNATALVSATNPGFPEKPILFTYRSDDNGTTLAFTNFLSAAIRANPLHCTGSGETWGLNSTFINALPTPPNQDTTNFIGAYLDTGVVASIEAQDGSIGYVEAANIGLVHTFHTYLAKIYAYAIDQDRFLKDPIADLPGATRFITTFKKDDVVALTCGNTGYAGVIASSCDGTGTLGRPSPDIVAVSGAYKAGCLGIVDPAAYAAPALGYPIVGVSNLEFYSSGNGIYATGLRFLADILTNPHTVFGTGGITTVDKAGAAVGTTGFSTLAIADVFYTNSSIGLLPNCID